MERGSADELLDVAVERPTFGIHGRRTRIRRSGQRSRLIGMRSRTAAQAYFLRSSRVPDGRPEEMLAGWWWYQAWSAAILPVAPTGFEPALPP